MKTELLGQEKNFVNIKLDYEAAELDKAIKKSLNKLSNDINIKGFRKGHAPRRIIEMQVGKDYLMHEAVENLVNGSLNEIVNEYELDMLASPTLKPYEVHEGEPFSCELTFEVMPEVKLPEFSEISVERVKTNITDEMVEQLVMQIRRGAATPYKVGTGEGEQDRAIEPDDLVKVDFKSQVEGEEGDYPSQTRMMDLSDPTIRAVVRDALVGHKVGDFVTADFRAEDDYPQKEVAGKAIHYDMTITGVTGRTLPELNEEFYKKFLGDDTEIKTEETFRTWCRDSLTTSVTSQYKNEAAGRALSEITKRAELDMSDTLVNREIEAQRQRDTQEAMQRYGLDLKTFLGGDTDPNWEKNYLDVLKARSENAVRNALVINAIAKENNLTVDKEDLMKWAQEQADVYRTTPDAVLAQLAQNREIMNVAIDDARQMKVIEFVMSKVNVQDVDQLSEPKPAENPVETEN